MYRLGVTGDEERAEREDAAREYFDTHGEWPEEAEGSGGRRWTMPSGVVTAEEEERERRASG